MKKIIYLATVAVLLLPIGPNIKSVEARADNVVVVANSNSGIQLTQQEVKSLFMGGAVAADLKPVALPANNPTRVVFNTKVLGLTETRVQSYWAQMRFTGRKKPPLEVQDQISLIEYLLANPNTVGYLPLDADIPAELSVVYRPEQSR